MKLYKLTDKDGYTRRGLSGETLWCEGLVVEAKEPGNQLCTNQVIHAYLDPRLAILLNPIHANIKDPILWECSGDVVADDFRLKVGVKTLTCISKIDAPAFTSEERVRIAILKSFTVYKVPEYREWCRGWMDGSDRSSGSATRLAQALYGLVDSTDNIEGMSSVLIAAALLNVDDGSVNVDEEVERCVARSLEETRHALSVLHWAWLEENFPRG